MALTITRPTTGYIGAGMDLVGTWAPITLPTSDMIVVEIFNAGGGLVSTSSAWCQDDGTWQCTVGRSKEGEFTIPRAGAALGSAVTIHLSQQHTTTPGEVDSATITGYSHDPVSGLGAFFTFFPSPAEGIELMNEILACVRRTFPST